MNTPFRVASTTALTNEHLPSPATYVLVDNTTNQWLYQPDAQRFIAPYAMNVVLPLKLAAGANMAVQAPTGLTQAAPIAGQQYLATFSDAPQPGYPYTSQMDVAIAGGTVNANILNSSLDVSASIVGGTVNANITNSVIDATIQNSTLDVTATLVHTIMNGVVTGDIVFASNAWTELGWGGNKLAGWSLTLVGNAVPTHIELATGPVGGPYTPALWHTILTNNAPQTIFMPSGLALPCDTVLAIYIFGAAAEILVNFYPAT